MCSYRSDFAVQVLAKFAEDDRIEQMNAQKRRMKQREHQRAVERMLEERRVQSAARQVRLCLVSASVSRSLALLVCRGCSDFTAIYADDTRGVPYSSTLYCANLPSLQQHRDQQARDFLKINSPTRFLPTLFTSCFVRKISCG